MSWKRILEIDPGENVPLRQRINALFDQQRATWPMLREGEAALAHLQKKTLAAGGESVTVQMNPARRRSTQAATDAKAVATRACFLCPENMPAEERGVAFEDLVVMPNPFPVLPMHCTIAAREHRPQRIEGQLEKFLRLAAALGPDLAVLYNGPMCGASAPDHFHFQCVRAAEMPIWSQLPELGLGIAPFFTFGRELVFARDESVELTANYLEPTVNGFPRDESDRDEPKLNLAAHFADGRFTTVLFPRAKHRPDCYFATGADRLAVSPAVLEMCGVLVVTEPADFERMDVATARAIYEEVCRHSDGITPP
jgi:Domain of unknown function (DUF4922)